MFSNLCLRIILYQIYLNWINAQKNQWYQNKGENKRWNIEWYELKIGKSKKFVQTIDKRNVISNDK
jgi:hypothetical protein